ncbi:MAG: ATP-binding protein [Lachnospiraceae bacterium]|nr:ATP-binding protein [Lachnospiraceae bacterium]
MGYYLNSASAFSLYESEAKKPYFVDKTEMLRELIPLVEQGNNHVCITRPRRFGKSIMAAMVAAFFGKGVDSSCIFDSLKIAKNDAKNPNENFDEPEEIDYRNYMNQYDVIYINFIEPANETDSYEQFISSVKEILQEDLRETFPDVKFRKNGTVTQDLRMIYSQTRMKFILVFDEWDCIFHKGYITNEDRNRFINWLAAMTKDTGYVALTYMTGVLPIAKYSSGSTINNFLEYTMAAQPKYSEYFGFSDDEVDMLYARYLENEKKTVVTRDDLRLWYDGYCTAGGTKLYNPRSVVLALTNNCLSSYWTTTGPYSELSRYIVNDVDGVKKDIALMVAGESVSSKIEEFAATAMHLDTKDEIFSAMVVYGFLNYEAGKVRIPNKELMDEFAKTIRSQKDLGYIHRLAVASDRMLQATLKGDTKTMEEVLQFAHDTETPLLDYNNETELTAIVNLVYLAARDFYYVERENKAGEGYVDFIFYPERPGDDGIILELKVDDTPEAAIQQIKDRKYVLKFQGKMAEKKRHIGQIRMVGIGYDRKKKDHHCRIEVL